MKKIAIGVIAALVLLYPLTTWLIGFAIERRFESDIGQMTEKTPYATVVDHHFRRGWYTSDQDLTVELLHDVIAALPASAGVGSPAAPLRVTIRSVIHHGPICGSSCFGLARVDTHVEFNAPLQESLARVFGSLEPVSIRSRLGLFGGGTTTISSPPFTNAAFNEGTQASWGGLAATMDYTSHYDSYVIHVSLPLTKFSGADGKRFEVTDAELDAHSSRALRSLYAGDSSFAVGKMQFVPGGAASAAAGAPAGAFAIQDLRSESHSTASQGYMTMVLKAGTGAITTTPLTLTAMHFDFTLRHWEVDSLERLTAALQQANADRSTAPSARAGLMLAALNQPAASLLSHEPEIAIDRISFADSGGEALLNGLVRLNGVGAADFASGVNLPTLMQKLDANLDLTLDEALLTTLPGIGASAAAQLQPLTDRGLFTHESGKFRTKIQFHQGQLTFNGKPFQLGPPPPAPLPAPSMQPTPRPH